MAKGKFNPASLKGRISPLAVAMASPARQVPFRTGQIYSIEASNHSSGASVSGRAHCIRAGEGLVAFIGGKRDQGVWEVSAPYDSIFPSREGHSLGTNANITMYERGHAKFNLYNRYLPKDSSTE